MPDSQTLDKSSPDQAFFALRDKFLKWQCRVRQMAMRAHDGRPDAAISPKVFLSARGAAFGHIITVLNKNPANSMTPELQHMARKTNDPALVRAQAIQFLAATYFQKHRSFSDLLTAVFAPGSATASSLINAPFVTLEFAAYAQDFCLFCRVHRLSPAHPLYDATLAHNRLFNLSLPAGSIVLGFEPDWQKCTDKPHSAEMLL